MDFLTIISIHHPHVSVRVAQLKRIRSWLPSEPFTFGKAHFSVRPVVSVAFVLAKIVCKRSFFNRYMGTRLWKRGVGLDRTRGYARFEPRWNLSQESSEREWNPSDKGLRIFGGSYRLRWGATHFDVCHFGSLIDDNDCWYEREVWVFPKRDGVMEAVFWLGIKSADARSIWQVFSSQVHCCGFCFMRPRHCFCFCSFHVSNFVGQCSVVSFCHVSSKALSSLSPEGSLVLRRKKENNVLVTTNPDHNQQLQYYELRLHEAQR